MIRTALLAALLLPQEAPPGVQRQVEQTLQAFATAVEGEDLNAAMALFSDDFREWCDDKADVAAMFADVFQTYDDLSIEVSGLSVSGHGTSATVAFTLSFEGTHAATGDVEAFEEEVGPDNPSVFRVLRREKGQWRFYGTHEGPPDVEGPPTMGLPVEDLAAVTNIHAYVAPSAAAPLTDAHPGLDFRYPSAGFNFVAAEAGRVKQVEFQEYVSDEYPWSRYEVIISYNCDYDILYTFEPFGIVTLEEMQAALPLRRGDLVAKGQVVGTLLWSAEAAHVHFGIQHHGEWVCPGDYFDAATYDALTAQYQATGFLEDLAKYPLLCNE